MTDADRREIIAATISDLRMYMAATTVKNPLLMIDEFEAGYEKYLQEREMGNEACSHISV